MEMTATFGSPVRAGGLSVAVAGASAVTASFLTKHTGTLRLCSTTDCFYEVGASDEVTPVAAANTSVFLPAGIPEYVSAPRNCKVAVIQATASGTLYVSQF